MSVPRATIKSVAQSNMQKAIILTIVSNLAIGAIICAPSSPAPPQPLNAATPSSSSATSSASGSQSAATKQSAAAAAAADKPKPVSTSAQFSSAASSVSGSPSNVNILRQSDGAQGNQRSQAAEEMYGGAFDGKNPFADDSLWQIPINLVRDLSSNRDEKDDIMAKQSSNSELFSADENEAADDDGDQVAPPASKGALPSSPTVISASTDLKTAAGYHYPSSHEHHGYGSGYGGGHEALGGHHAGYAGGHHGGYGGGHHGGDHHYGGKYFQ